MRNTPINSLIVAAKIRESELDSLDNASIREIVKLVNQIEKETGEKYIRMEMGVPGLPSPLVGIEAEKAALDDGVTSIYPNVEGLPQLKNETSRFIKLFLDIDVNPRGCIPTVGSLMGGMAGFMVVNRNDRTREGTLFIDPGFPVQKQQVKILGQDYRSFDVYNYRGTKLRAKLESYLETGKVSSILYSNPNNPSWICFTDEELKIIGELATRYDVVVIEDLAYFGMDFRNNYGTPGKAPFQPTVAKYCDNYLLLISSSKAFSYAGQRVGMLVISDTLYNRRFPDLKRYYTSDLFGHAMVFGALYALSAGVTHTAQYGLYAMLKAVNNGEYNYISEVKEYGERARMIKQMFIANGFKIVYDTDIDRPIADGFYFTISFPGMSSGELLEKLLYYGISAITLNITGSDKKEGLRACVSQIPRTMFPLLETRLQRFYEDFK
ncbi:MAG TPA: pyridoxal phosphate-dependent aminotransferase [Bacteroidetes bacterium]|nr:pyridoxal phosphate-dependent aminotransferase [Bacteroidota bacterium]